MDSVYRRRHLLGGVAPFGHPRILACNGSPWHFAVYCVLHRLLMPRYPPCALCSLTKQSNCLHSLNSRTGKLSRNADLHWWILLRTFSICSFQGTDPKFNRQPSGKLVGL